MGLSINPTELVELAQKHWYKPPGLIVSLILVLALVSALLLVISPIPLVASLIIYGITASAVVFVWAFTRRVPKTKKAR